MNKDTEELNQVAKANEDIEYAHIIIKSQLFITLPNQIPYLLLILRMVDENQVDQKVSAWVEQLNQGKFFLFYLRVYHKSYYAYLICLDDA